MIIKKYPHTSQDDEYDCGAACITSFLKYFKIRTNLNIIKNLFNINTNGLQLVDLYNFLYNLGTQPKLYKINNEFVEELDSAFSQLNFPLIALISKDIMDHYIVIYKIKNGIITYSDPAEHKILKVNLEDFIHRLKYLVVPYNTDTISFNLSILPIYSNEIVSYVLNIVKKNKKYLLKIFFFSVIINILSILASYYSGIIIDSILPKSSVNLLNIVTILFLTICSLKVLLEFFRNKVLLLTGRKIEENLHNEYVDKVFNLTISEFKMKNIGDFTSRLSDSLILVSMTSNVIVTSIIDLVLIFISGILLYNINKFLFLISIIPLALYLFISIIFFDAIYIANKNTMKKQALFNSFFIESLNNMEDIKALNKESYFITSLNKNIDSYLSKSLNLSYITNIHNFFKILINSLFIIIVTYLGAMQIIEKTLTLGELITFNAMLVYFFESVKNLIDLQPDIEKMIVASRRLFNIINYVSTDGYACSRYDFKEKIKSISFSNVSYKILDNEILNDISLKIYESDSVLIFGESGVGKSTIAKFLSKLDESYYGDIFINNINLRSIDNKKIRSKIYYLSNNKFLLSKSIIENLCLGNTFNQDDIIRACEDACILDFIESLPNKFETKILENAKNLSLGQVQRLIIARALLHNPDVMIFDESLSNIDKKNKEKILINLSKYNFIKIFISHDFDFKYYTKIFEISNNTITQINNFTEDNVI